MEQNNLIVPDHSETAPISRPGKLKIFLGYAPGVGKTYAMLEAAHEAATEGIDVVAGYIDAHTRPETMKLLSGIELLPSLVLPNQEKPSAEFDLDGALKRCPRLILIDELAHTNSQGCRHRKRYQDIQEVLKAGIDVYTTVNIQHLESLNDVVSSITGIVVTERVPDRIFDLAEQVQVVDVEPDELILRMEAGRIGGAGRDQDFPDEFFTRKNLAALRELALRRTADRLNRSARNAGEHAKANAGEHILICLSSAPSNSKVIRTAARMAEAFHSDFTALYVETPEFKEMDADNQEMLRSNLKLAEDLGARIATAYGDDAAVQIAEYAKASGVSKIVLGRTNHKRRMLRSTNLVDRLTLLAPNLDIYIIPDSQSLYRPKRRGSREWLSWEDCAKTVITILLASLFGWGFYKFGVGESNIITIYILGVLFISTWTNGKIYGAIASLVSVMVYNFLFTEPQFTLRAYDAGYPMTFVVMLVASFITSSLTMRVKSQASLAAKKAYRTEVLLETSQKLQKAVGQEQILEVAAMQLGKLLERPIVFYPLDGDGKLGIPIYYSKRTDQGHVQEYEQYMTKEEHSVAQWVIRNNKHAGATTNTFSSAKCLYLAVRGQNLVLAAAGIFMEGLPEPDAYEKNLMLSMLDECGLALDKDRLDGIRRQVELSARQEALRANLLRAISHDLRTPLTSISGNAGILMENSSVLDEVKKQLLYVSIYDDSMWLVNLVENLLSVTRIENGSMKIKMEPELLDEVFHEAINHLDRKASEHTIQVQLEDDLLMAEMDARLVVQVVINIINNAIKYTPPGSNIQVSAKRTGNMVLVRIADDGPGIPNDAKEHLFDMFYTANNSRGDGRRGLGLGLSLCRSIVNAHGGIITVEDNVPEGTIFSFTLHACVVEL